MSTTLIEEHAFPRPVSALPEFAHAAARRTLAEKLSEAFNLSTAAAITIASSVVDPAAVRKALGDPTEPEVEHIAVPGGTLLGLRTLAWARRVMPDPRNPRTLPSRRHPFAVDPGCGGEDSKFRPIPEPRARDPEHPQLAELEVDIENRHHLIWAMQHAAKYVLSVNDWRTSIATQGVMEAVWLVATTYRAHDDTEPVTALVSAEGSSRMTANHHLLDVPSADIPYESNDAAFRAHLRKLNASLQSGPTSADLIALRCEQIPALILVGFTPYAGGTTEFSTAVKSFVALRHVDPPKPWGAGPENESLADEVLDEMFRRHLISATERAYYAGSCTKAEATAAHLSADAALRAASIVRLLTPTDLDRKDAIRMAVTSQSTRKNITSRLANELATALILRAVALDPSKTDQIRRYMQQAFGKSVHKAQWENTGRATAQLVADALHELREAITQGVDNVGPSAIELAVRAAYPLLVSGRLNADRGYGQPDRRTPSEVLDAMSRSPQGIHQLGQALVDFKQGTSLRAVDPAGAIRKGKDGTSDAMINDIYLRAEFPAAGKHSAPLSGDTPQIHFHNSVVAMSAAMEAARHAFATLAAITGDDGYPLVETQGVDYRLCGAWRTLHAEIDEELVVWSRTYRRVYGTGESPPAMQVPEGSADEPDTGPFTDPDSADAEADQQIANA